MEQTSVIPEKIQRSIYPSQVTAHCRLDIANQKRGDFKETFNMGKFADATYQQNLPPIITSYWPEIQAFQKRCHNLSLRVLTLFALALNVLDLK